MSDSILDTLDELKKRKLQVEIAKYEEEIKGIALRNEAQFLEIEQHKLKGTQNYLYTFYNPIIQPTVADCISTLGTWTRKAPKGQEINMLLHSPGGTVSDGLGLYDYIKSIRKDYPFTIKVFGGAYSMAAIVLQAATKRIMQPNASLMVHSSSLTLEEGAELASHELEDTSKRMAALNDRLYTILADRSKLTKAQIKKRCNRKDAWIEAEEALELGLIDAIET